MEEGEGRAAQLISIGRKCVNFGSMEKIILYYYELFSNGTGYPMN